MPGCRVKKNRRAERGKHVKLLWKRCEIDVSRGKNVNSMVTVLEIFAALRAVKAGARCQVAAAKKNSPRFAREGCEIRCVKSM